MTSAKKHVFTPLEKKMFQDILKKYTGVIENKNTDGSSLHAKKYAWDSLTVEFNASPYVSTKSTSQQLRRLWMNLKQRQKDATKERQHQLATGGGTSASDSIIEPEVSQVAPAPLVSVDDAFDSESIAEMAVDVKPSSMENVIILSVPVHTLETKQETPLSLTESILPPPLPRTPPPPSVPPSPPTPIPSSSTQQSIVHCKMSILEREYRHRQVRAYELHELQIVLLKEKIREAKAKADLGELLLRQQQNLPGPGPS